MRMSVSTMPVRECLVSFMHLHISENMKKQERDKKKETRTGISAVNNPVSEFRYHLRNADFSSKSLGVTNSRSTYYVSIRILTFD